MAEEEKAAVSEEPQEGEQLQINIKTTTQKVAVEVAADATVKQVLGGEQ